MIEGDLRNVPLTDVFQVIANSQKSGALTLLRGRHRARVYFDQGRVQYGHLSAGVNLGEILVRMELLSVGEVLQLLTGHARENAGLPLGQAAVTAGFLDEDGLKVGLERQVFEVLSELLTWRSGHFSFGEGSGRPGPLESVHSFDALSLLMQVSQRLSDYEEGAVKPEAVYHRVGDPTKVAVPDGAWEVLATVDGRRAAASIAAELELPERQVYHLLHSLERLRVIEPSPFAVEVPLVLLLSPSNAYARLLRLLLLRSRALPRIESEPRVALSFLAENHPRAIIADDHDGSSWQFVREVRRLPGKAHLPVVVLTPAGGDAGVLSKMRRPKALTLAKPFRELEFQQLLARMVGALVG